jgi:hypothetical protein
MPPKKKKDEEEDPMMKAARFGRVKNTLTMGFGAFKYHGLVFAFGQLYHPLSN